MTESSEVSNNSKKDTVRQSELNKAHHEILFLRKCLKEYRTCLRSTERTIKAYLTLGKADGVVESIELKQRMMRHIERVTNELIEARKNFDLWKAIEEVHAHAQ